MPLKAGQNPRAVLSDHSERGPRRFSYTYEDIADFLSMSPGAVRVAVSRGHFDPTSIQSIFEFSIKRANMTETRSLRALIEEARHLVDTESEQ